MRRFAQKVTRSILASGVAKAPRPLVIGLSGGKDSLALALACAEGAAAYGSPPLVAVYVDAVEFPLEASHRERLACFCDARGIGFSTVSVSAIEEGKGVSCWRCARERRKALLEKARASDASAVLLGHHLDDAATTALMNLCLHGRLETMPRAADFMGIAISRPMLDIPEASIALVAERLALPVVPSACPRACATRRDDFKRALAVLSGFDTLVKERIARAAAPDPSRGSWEE